MRTSLPRARAWVATFLGAVFLLAVPVGSAAAGDCEATIVASQRKTEQFDYYVRYVFALEARSKADCANVSYDLVVRDQSQDGSIQTKRLPGRIRVRNGVSSARKTEYRLTRGHTLVDWRFEVTDCRLCGATP
jgi:hypothetical protein